MFPSRNDLTNYTLRPLSYCYHPWLAVVALVILSTFLNCFYVSDSHAYPNINSSTKIQSNTNLFALSLEELINLRVDGRSSSDEYQNEITIIKGKEINDFVENLTQIGKIEEDLGNDSNKTTQKTLLLIDGYRIGYIDSAIDLRSYIQYFKRNLLKVEIYTGQSATWLNGDRDEDQVSGVVNLVTDYELQISEEVPQS